MAQARVFQKIEEIAQQSEEVEILQDMRWLVFSHTEDVDDTKRYHVHTFKFHPVQGTTLTRKIMSMYADKYEEWHIGRTIFENEEELKRTNNFRETVYFVKKGWRNRRKRKAPLAM